MRIKCLTQYWHRLGTDYQSLKIQTFHYYWAKGHTLVLFLPIKSNKEGKKILRQLPNQFRVDYYLLSQSCWSICASKILPTTKGSIVSKENYEINDILTSIYSHYSWLNFKNILECLLFQMNFERKNFHWYTQGITQNLHIDVNLINIVMLLNFLNQNIFMLNYVHFSGIT